MTPEQIQSNFRPPGKPPLEVSMVHCAERQYAGSSKETFTLNPSGFESKPHHLTDFCVGFLYPNDKKR